jgi:hypothetical protein
MKHLWKSLAAVGFLAALFAAPGDAQVSNPNGCTLSGCTAAYSVNGIQSFVKTYKYTSLGNTPAATPSDIFAISGSATRTIRITKIVVGGFATTTAGDLNPIIVHRKTLDTGGASTNPVGVARDVANDGVPTAVLTLYTANPTTGTLVGNEDSCRLFLQVPATGAPDVCAFTYGVNNDQLPVLYGVNDNVAINFAGATLPSGGSGIDIDVEWTEE